MAAVKGKPCTFSIILLKCYHLTAKSTGLTIYIAIGHCNLLLHLQKVGIAIGIGNRNLYIKHEKKFTFLSNKQYSQALKVDFK